MYLVIVNEEDAHQVNAFDNIKDATVSFDEAVKDPMSTEVILCNLKPGAYFGFAYNGYYGPDPIKEWRNDD
jgi:hypothetical protein